MSFVPGTLGIGAATPAMLHQQVHELLTFSAPDLDTGFERPSTQVETLLEGLGS